MAVLFLDPLVLTLLLGVLVHVWLVWRGTLRWWFGRRARWTVLVWPLPLLLVAVPVVAGGSLWLLGRAGVGAGAGGLAGAALYAALYGVPSVGLLLWPPRWVLPRWARARLNLPPPAPMPTRADAVPACHGHAGHGSRARWVWRVDTVPGWVWTASTSVAFQAAARQDIATPDVAVDLAEVDRWHVRATRPWRRDGLLTLEVAGRDPLHLWVADHRVITRQLTHGTAASR